MTLAARLSQAAALVKAFEPFHAAAEPGANGWTIGYGHTASAREGASVSPDEADALLLYDLSRAAAVVDMSVYAPLNDNQRQAMAAFGFNIGAQNLRRSTALRRLNAGDYLGAAREIERWRRAELAGEGQVVDALVRRRAAEKALFLTPPEGFPKTSTPRLRPAFDPAQDLDFSDAALYAAAEPPTASMLAAQGVSERLRALVPDPESDPEPTVDPPVRDEPKPAFDDPFGSPDPSPSTPDSVSEPFAASAADASSAFADGPPPPPFATRAEAFEPPFPANETAAPLVITSADSRRYDPPPAGVVPHRQLPALTAAKPKTAAAPAGRGPTIVSVLLRLGPLMVGVIGAALFVFAAASIVTRRPSAANLVIGLIGVLCLTPAVFVALGGRQRRSS